MVARWRQRFHTFVRTRSVADLSEISKPLTAQGGFLECRGPLAIMVFALPPLE
jgi:hypothetical protein